MRTVVMEEVTIMFINLDGEVFHVLLQGEVGAWVISCDEYGMPVYLD